MMRQRVSVREQGIQHLEPKILNSNPTFRRQRLQVHKNHILQVLFQQTFLSEEYRMLHILSFMSYPWRNLHLQHLIHGAGLRVPIAQHIN